MRLRYPDAMACRLLPIYSCLLTYFWIQIPGRLRYRPLLLLLSSLFARLSSSPLSPMSLRSPANCRGLALPPSRPSLHRPAAIDQPPPFIQAYIDQPLPFQPPQRRPYGYAPPPSANPRLRALIPSQPANHPTSKTASQPCIHPSVQPSVQPS